MTISYRTIERRERATARAEEQESEHRWHSDHDPPIKHLMLDGAAIQFNNNELEYVGKGVYGFSVYRAVYGGIACAIKQQHLVGTIGHSLPQSEVHEYTVQDFQRECLLHSKLHHSNIVKMYGVCCHSEMPGQLVKVMEFVDGGSLSSLLNNYHNIPIYVKLSILQDVSRGLHYLHCCRLPIMHSNITTDIIMLTSTLTAKIGSFTFAREVVPKMERVSFK